MKTKPAKQAEAYIDAATHVCRVILPTDVHTYAENGEEKATSSVSFITVTNIEFNIWQIKIFCGFTLNSLSFI